MDNKNNYEPDIIGITTEGEALHDNHSHLHSQTTNTVWYE